MFSVAPSRMPSTVLRSIAANTKGYDHLPVLERRAVDHDGAQPQLAQRTLHQLLHLLAAGLDEVLAHRRFLDAIGVVKVLHHRTVVARRKPAHHLVPHAHLHRSAALEQLVAAQTLFTLVGRTQPRSPDRHFLAVHHAVAVLFAPAMRAAPFVLLMALAGQVPDFLFHHRLHQRQPRLPQQVAHALLQQADDLGQRQDHLDVRVLFGGDPAELLHGSLLFDLVLFLQATLSFFLGRKTHRRPIMAASLRVATFYDLPGNLNGTEQNLMCSDELTSS